MRPIQRKILAGTLLLTGLVVLSYVPLILLAGLEFSFATFALYVLFPCLAIYFAGAILHSVLSRNSAGAR